MAMPDTRPFQFLQREFAALAQARVICVATVRKDNTQSKAAPMWFTIAPDGKILIQSGPNSWQIRRIRRGSPVLVWIGRRGRLAFLGTAEITDDPMAVERIITDYPKKYWIAWLGMHRPTKTSFARGERLAIQITPVHSLPQDMSSRPGAPIPPLASAPVNFD
jgi:hypothetical protein